MDGPNWRNCAAISDLLDTVMASDKQASVLDVVALLADLPAQKLARGQVGTVVESLDSETALVEFSAEDGKAFAIVPCFRRDLLVLHYVPEAAA
jgi:hypothetical protein